MENCTPQFKKQHKKPHHFPIITQHFLENSPNDPDRNPIRSNNINQKKKTKERNIPSNSTPEYFRRSTEVDRSMRRLGIHPLTKKTKVFHLLPNKTTRKCDLFATNNNNALSTEKLLGNNGSQTTQHVVTGVHHHSLGHNS